MDFSFIIMIVIIILGIILSAKEKIEEWGMEDVFSNMRREIKGRKLNKLDENSYRNYTQFFGTEELEDKEFIKKMRIIYSQIMKDNEENIKQIAELSGCTYPECILKIKYLKQIKRIPEEYFIDEANGLVNRCSKEDQELLKKYRPYICRSKLQIPQIVARIPHTPGKTYEEMKKQVLDDLAYLDEKDLINGIILNKVDETITYYNYQTTGDKTDKITVTCQNCGAPNEVNRGGKTWCEYCGTIVEDKSLDEKGE